MQPVDPQEPSLLAASSRALSSLIERRGWGAQGLRRRRPGAHLPQLVVHIVEILTAAPQGGNSCGDLRGGLREARVRIVVKGRQCHLAVAELRLGAVPQTKFFEIGDIYLAQLHRLP